MYSVPDAINCPFFFRDNFQIKAGGVKGKAIWLAWGNSLGILPFRRRVLSYSVSYLIRYLLPWL